MLKKAYRMGIDVGGTHTKAIALDNQTHEIVAKASVKTTHDHPDGVAAGVVASFEKCLKVGNISPDDVVFIAHSTTQATNALLEGDVASVGVLGMGKGFFENIMAKKQTNIGDVTLTTGKKIHVVSDYQKVPLTKERVAQSIDGLLSQGAGVIVASKAFGVDDMQEELLVRSACMERGIPCSMASDITKLYGLTIRTRTAAINASILPKMLSTANSTEQSVRNAGIKVPLMIMRGDAGVMDIDEMRKRPVLTMLSGPAASVVGALMYLRASNGIYFEVGGTSVNIGVIKNGRPAVDYATVGSHRTYINSLDVRVLGVAGGSMVRAANGKIVDVGPRSAHIAGCEYAAFTPPEEIEDPKLVFVSPKPGDPGDYVAIELKNGKRIAITNTCAANILGLVDEKYFAHGNRESCMKAIRPLAEYLGLSEEDTAREILKTASDKILPVITELAEKYKLDRDQMMLIGVGGGAASLIPFTAQRMELSYGIPENAEVISSIGVALAMVRDVVERVIPNPTGEDIEAIKQEARTLAVNNGALPDTVEVYIEIDALSQKVTAIALGSSEIHTSGSGGLCDVDEAREIAAQSLNVECSAVQLLGNTGGLYVFSAEKGKKTPVRIVDNKGFVKVQHGNGAVRLSTCGHLREDLGEFWKANCVYRNDIVMPPDIYVCLKSRLLDYSGIQDINQLLMVLEPELAGEAAEQDLVIVGAKNDL